MNKLLFVFLTLTLTSLTACKPDVEFIDHYEVGDEVELDKVSKGCHGVILEYIPISKYRVKIKCPFLIPNSLEEAVFSEFSIIGRHRK